MIWNDRQRTEWAVSADLCLLPNDKSRRIARLILHNLAHRADEKTLVCWPSIESIAEHASVSSRTIMRTLPELEAADFILCGRKRRRGNMYFILISDFDEQAISDITVSLNGDGFEAIRGRISDILARISDTGGRISDTQMSHQHRTIEQKENNKRKEVIKIPDWLNSETFSDFVEHRASLKAPMSPKAQRLLITKLDKHRSEGHNPNELLNTAIMSGWKSVYPPKPESNNGRSKKYDRIQAELSRSGIAGTDDNLGNVHAFPDQQKIGK